MPASRILLARYYGFGNAGDEAILVDPLAHLRELRPDAVVTVVSGDPRETARTYGSKPSSGAIPSALDDAARQGGPHRHRRRRPLPPTTSGLSGRRDTLTGPALGLIAAPAASPCFTRSR